MKFLKHISLTSSLDCYLVWLAFYLAAFAWISFLFNFSCNLALTLDRKLSGQEAPFRGLCSAACGFKKWYLLLDSVFLLPCFGGLSFILFCL